MLYTKWTKPKKKEKNNSNEYNDNKTDKRLLEIRCDKKERNASPFVESYAALLAFFIVCGAGIVIISVQSLRACFGHWTNNNNKDTHTKNHILNVFMH